LLLTLGGRRAGAAAKDPRRVASVARQRRRDAVDDGGRAGERDNAEAGGGVAGAASASCARFRGCCRGIRSGRGVATAASAAAATTGGRRTERALPRHEEEQRAAGGVDLRRHLEAVAARQRLRRLTGPRGVDLGRGGVALGGAGEQHRAVGGAGYAGLQQLAGIEL